MGIGRWTSKCNNKPVNTLTKQKKKETLHWLIFIRFYTYERVQEIVEFIQKLISTKPEVAIICGSGLGGLAELIINKIVIPYSDIPHFPKSTGWHLLCFLRTIYLFEIFVQWLVIEVIWYLEHWMVFMSCVCKVDFILMKDTRRQR